MNLFKKVQMLRVQISLKGIARCFEQAISKYSPNTALSLMKPKSEF